MTRFVQAILWKRLQSRFWPAISLDQPRWRATVAASSARVRRSSLRRQCETWVCTVRGERNSRAAICGLVRPCSTSSATCSSVGVRLPQPWVGRAAGAAGRPGPVGPRSRAAGDAAGVTVVAPSDSASAVARAAQSGVPDPHARSPRPDRRLLPATEFADDVAAMTESGCGGFGSARDRARPSPGPGRRPDRGARPGRPGTATVSGADAGEQRLVACGQGDRARCPRRRSAPRSPARCPEPWPTTGRVSSVAAASRSQPRQMRMSASCATGRDVHPVSPAAAASRPAADSARASSQRPTT